MNSVAKKIGIVALVGALGFGIVKSSLPYKNHPDKTYQTTLVNAKEVVVQESGWSNIIPFRAKRYHVLVDGYKVATVKGNVITEFGNSFSLTTVDDKVLATEKEKKRWMRLSWNRGAEFRDNVGNVSGYVAEEKARDLFSFYYKFHFYNKDMDEVAVSKKLTNSAFGNHEILSSSGQLLYDIDKKWVLNPFADRYVIKQFSTNAVGKEQAILLTCIEDIIGDSQSSD